MSFHVLSEHDTVYIALLVVSRKPSSQRGDEVCMQHWRICDNMAVVFDKMAAIFKQTATANDEMPAV